LCINDLINPLSTTTSPYESELYIELLTKPCELDELNKNVCEPIEGDESKFIPPSENVELISILPSKPEEKEGSLNFFKCSLIFLSFSKSFFSLHIIKINNEKQLERKLFQK
jgi:hypothetical protein